MHAFRDGDRQNFCPMCGSPRLGTEERTWGEKLADHWVVNRDTAALGALAVKLCRTNRTETLELQNRYLSEAWKMVFDLIPKEEHGSCSHPEMVSMVVSLVWEALKAREKRSDGDT
jgi:hypothetical protein